MRIWIFALLLSCFAHAQEDAERVNVDKIKKKYWAKGKASQVGVVQNRKFTKAGRMHVGTSAGITFGDPFLSIKTWSLSGGYHFSEFFGLTASYWRYVVGPAAALEQLESSLTATSNTNHPKDYLGVEADYSMIYGKLSFFGKSIVYYDLHLLGGAGLINTESGRYLSPHIGLGQRIFFTQFLSLRLDYRLSVYRETLLEKEVPTLLGTERGQRNAGNHSISLGIDVMFDPFGSKKK